MQFGDLLTFLTWPHNLVAVCGRGGEVGTTDIPEVSFKTLFDAPFSDRLGRFFPLFCR
jgi:hypothetical protein